MSSSSSSQISEDKFYDADEAFPDGDEVFPVQKPGPFLNHKFGGNFTIKPLDFPVFQIITAKHE